MFGVLVFLAGLGLGEGALVLSRWGKEEGARRPGGLCGNSSLLYCDKPRTYPARAIKRALRRQSNMLEMFDKEDTINAIVKRSIGDWSDACPSSQNMLMPRVGTNVNNQQRYLVNGGIRGEFGPLVQLVRVTTCDAAGESCAAGRFGVQTRCAQQFSQHKLVAFDEVANELVVESFTFPSSCSCMYRDL